MKKYALVLVALALIACSKDDKKVTNSGGITANACGRDSVVSGNEVGDCRIRLLSPTACQEVDLTNDKVFEFRWTTDGTDCPSQADGRMEGFNIYVAGNPVTKNEDGSLNNVASKPLRLGGTIERSGGIAYVRARDLVDGEGNPITSTDGTFDWAIRSGLEAGPASVVFRIKR